MDKIIKDFAQKVANDGREKLRGAMRTVVKRVEEDFMKQAKRCLDNYYIEYIPTEYNRTYNLKNNGINPYKRYRKNEVDVGVSFDPSKMKPYPSYSAFSGVDGKPYIANREQLVIANAMEGVHGNESIYVGRNIDNTMTHFTSAYAQWYLDGYFQDLLGKI